MKKENETDDNDDRCKSYYNTDGTGDALHAGTFWGRGSWCADVEHRVRRYLVPRYIVWKESL